MDNGQRETCRLLDDLESYFRRFLILTPEQYAVLCVWTMHTYCYELGDFTPYLIVTSAEKRSGKTRLIESLRYVVHKPRTYSAPTPAALYRAVTVLKPTLMIDETDALFHDSSRGPSEAQEAMRGIINNGFERGMLIPRVMPNGDLAEFEVFGPKVLAGIGHLPDTIEDRGLPIRLVRKSVADKVERLRHRMVGEDTQRLRDDLAGWGAYAMINLDGVYPEMPDELDDRAQDTYELLVAIGELAGDVWGSRIRAALISLRSGQNGSEASRGIRLLEDLSLVDLSGREWIATPDLLALLYEYGEQPYEEWWGEASGKRAALRLSKLLKEYGVSPSQFWHDGAKKRGYRVDEISAQVALYAFNTVDPVGHADLQGKSPYRVAENGPDSTVLENGQKRLEQGVLPSLPCSNPPDAPLDVLRGSPEWLSRASMDELRDWQETLDTDV